MKSNSVFLLLLLSVYLVHAQDKLEPVDYVSILVGTQSKFELSNGNTYPAIAMPWGMNFWTPQTGKWAMDGFTATMRIRSADLSRHTNQVPG